MVRTVTIPFSEGIACYYCQGLLFSVPLAIMHKRALPDHRWKEPPKVSRVAHFQSAMVVFHKTSNSIIFKSALRVKQEIKLLSLMRINSHLQDAGRYFHLHIAACICGLMVLSFSVFLRGEIFCFCFLDDPPGRPYIICVIREIRGSLKCFGCGHAALCSLWLIIASCCGYIPALLASAAPGGINFKERQRNSAMMNHREKFCGQRYFSDIA